MPKFVYRQGEEFDGTKMPAEVTAFGIDFLKNTPAAVEPGMFDDPAKYEHALKKLRGNWYFEEARGKAAAAPPPAEEPAE